MLGLLLSYFALGLGYAPFTDLVVLPFLAVLIFSLFAAGYMPLPQKRLAATLVVTLLYFLLFTLIFPASVWFSEFRSFRSIADLLFIGVFFLEIIAGAAALLASVPWILKGPRGLRAYTVMGPLIVTLAGYCIFTAWRHHIGYQS